MTVLSRLIVASARNPNVSLLRELGRTRGQPPVLLSRGLRQPRRNNRQGGMNLAPDLGVDLASENSMGPKLLKCILFTTGFCGTTFVSASIWQYESLRAKAKGSWSEWANKKWNELDGWQNKQGEFRQEINRIWNNLSEGQKVFWPICFLNGVVYACWHSPSLRTTMFKYFCSNPAARAVCWPMFLSTFSHFAFLHFAMNMYVLHSFSSSVCASLGKEQFVGMYLCGGVMSSLASHAFKVATQCPGPSLGASGAIMALLGFFCTIHPNAQLGIVFIPGFYFSADTAIKSVMCLDAVGMALGWRMFDHAAHLGGALFGLLYAYFGSKHIWPKREPMIKQWHNFRNEMSIKNDNKPSKD